MTWTDLLQTVRSWVIRPTRGAALSGLRMALALVAAVALSQFFALGHGYWVILTMVVVMKSGLGATLLTSYQRVLGTAIGVAVGIPILFIPESLHGLLYVGLFLSLFSIGYATSRSYTVLVVCMTVFVFFLFPLLGGQMDTLFQERLLDTVLGAVVGTAFSMFVRPDMARTRLPHEYAAFLRACAAYFEDITAGEHCGVRENVELLSDIARKRDICAGTLQEARHEPGSGKTLRTGALVEAHLDRIYSELLHFKGAADILTLHCPEVMQSGRIPRLIIMLSELFRLTAELYERRLPFDDWEKRRLELRELLYQLPMEQLIRDDLPSVYLPVGMYLQHLRGIALEVSGCGDAYKLWLQTHEHYGLREKLRQRLRKA